ncbi:hypothetical protein HDZ31DRAFT_83333 [Schizophyllum fasciatum]
MGVDRPITEFFQPLKENKRGRKRRRGADAAPDAPDAKAAKTASDARRTGATANTAGPADARDPRSPSPVSPPARHRSNPLLVDTALSTPPAPKISAIAALHTPPLTGHPPEKRARADRGADADTVERPTARHALPTPVTLPRRRASPAPSGGSSSPRSPPFRFPFRPPEDGVPSSQPTQDAGASPRRRRGVFKVPRTPVRWEAEEDEVPSPDAPPALDSDDCVGTSQSQERFPLLGWRSRSVSPVKGSPVKAPSVKASPVKRSADALDREVASSVADEDVSYQELLGGIRPLASPSRKLNSSPSPPSRAPSPAAKALSQYSATIPGTYDDWGKPEEVPSQPSTQGADLRTPASKALSQYSATIPGTYDDWGRPEEVRSQGAGSPTRAARPSSQRPSTSSPTRPSGSQASPRRPSRSSTQLSETIPGTYDDWGKPRDVRSSQRRPSRSTSSTQLSATIPGTYDNWGRSSPQTQYSPTQPGTYDDWGKDEVGDGAEDDEGGVVGGQDGGANAQRLEDGDENAGDGASEAVGPAARRPAVASRGEALKDASQAEVDDMLSSDSGWSMSLYEGEGSFPNDFPESLKLRD